MNTLFLSLKSNCFLLLLTFWFNFSSFLGFSQDVNVLIIGSSHSYSEGREHGAIHEKPFSPVGVGSELQNILSSDVSISGNVNVVVEDIYTNKTKDTRVGSGSNNVRSMNFHRYSLAQYYVWPEGRNARLANLRGEGGINWDYVVLMADPYLLANMPGVFAEGVQLLSKEIAKGGAETILFAQWPENTSSFSVSDFNEVVYRIGNSAGLRVVPAGKSWGSLSHKDANVSHPTPKGAYLSAASIYSELFNKSASASSYVFINSTSTNEIAEHVFNTVKNNKGVSQYSGIYKGINPFQILNHTARHVDFCETGSSTENGIKPRLQGAISRLRMSNKPLGRSYAKSKGPIDLNYGRGNDWYEDNKDYEVNTSYYKNTIGFPMQDNHGAKQWAPTTMLYGIDKRFYNGVYYNDGTDLGIAYNMIRPGTREKGLPLNVRSVPVRLMWSRIYDADPSLKVVPDNNHMNGILLDAIGTYMATILTGRCSVNDEPDRSSSTWNKWYARKVAYETAWRMSHLTTRTPGFKVLPSSVDALTVDKDESEKLSVRFMFPPQSEVTVLVTSSNPSVGIVGPQKLIFTTENYNIAQEVRVKSVPGSSANAKFNIRFTTVSDDVVYNGLTDSWRYTNNRFSSSVTHKNKNSIKVETYKNITANISINSVGPQTKNTEFAGPNYGSLSWNGSNLEYKPNNNFTGSDGFAFWTRNNDTVTTGYVDITVLDGSPIVDITVQAKDSEASEEGLNKGVWEIIREGDISSNLEVNFSLNGMALRELDYSLNVSSPVTIPSGQNSVEIILTPIDDNVSGEGNELAFINLLEGSGYNMSNTDAFISISDNDEPLSLIFSSLSSDGEYNVDEEVKMDINLLGTLTDAEELKFLVKKEDSDFSVVYTTNINELNNHLYNWIPSETGVYSLMVLALKNGNNVTDIVVDNIVIRKPLNMQYIFLEDGSKFNIGNKVRMHSKLSGDYSSINKLKFIVQKLGESESVLKTLRVSNNKTIYKNRWAPKESGDYVLKVSAYSNDTYVRQITANVIAENPLRLKYNVLKNGQSYVVGDDVKMHVKVTGDLSKTDEIRFIVQKIGGSNKLDKTSAINPATKTYYNKWVPSLAGDYKLKVKAFKNGNYVKMTSAKIKVTAKEHSFRSMNAESFDDELTEVSIYPNPNSGVVNVNLGSSKNAEIKVFGSNGHVVYQKQSISGVHQFELNFSPGLYFVEVDSELGKQIFKMVKN